jgi:hypothetical protein
VYEHNGPASYVQASGGGDTFLTTPSWGGSSTVGTRGFSLVVGAVDNSGRYRADPFYGTGNTPNAGIRTAVGLRWTYTGTHSGDTAGAEVGAGVNLSGVTVRLMVVGG